MHIVFFYYIYYIRFLFMYILKYFQITQLTKIKQYTDTIFIFSPDRESIHKF